MSFRGPASDVFGRMSSETWTSTTNLEDTTEVTSKGGSTEATIGTNGTQQSSDVDSSEMSVSDLDAPSAAGSMSDGTRTGDSKGELPDPKPSERPELLAINSTGVSREGKTANDGSDEDNNEILEASWREYIQKHKHEYATDEDGRRRLSEDFQKVKDGKLFILPSGDISNERPAKQHLPKIDSDRRRSSLPVEDLIDQFDGPEQDSASRRRSSTGLGSEDHIMDPIQPKDPVLDYRPDKAGAIGAPQLRAENAQKGGSPSLTHERLRQHELIGSSVSGLPVRGNSVRSGATTSNADDDDATSATSHNTRASSSVAQVLQHEDSNISWSDNFPMIPINGSQHNDSARTLPSSSSFLQRDSWQYPGDGRRLSAGRSDSGGVSPFQRSYTTPPAFSEANRKSGQHSEFVMSPIQPTSDLGSLNSSSNDLQQSGSSSIGDIRETVDVVSRELRDKDVKNTMLQARVDSLLIDKRQVDVRHAKALDRAKHDTIRSSITVMQEEIIRHGLPANLSQLSPMVSPVASPIKGRDSSSMTRSPSVQYRQRQESLDKLRDVVGNFSQTLKTKFLEEEQAHKTDLEKLEAEQNAHQADLVKLRNEENEHAADLEKLAKEREEHAADLEKLAKEREEHAADLEKLRKEEESHAIDVEKLEKLRDEHAADLEKLSKEREEHAADLEKLAKEREEHAADLEKLKKEEESHAVDVERLEKEREDHAADLEKLRREREEHATDLEKLRKEEEAHKADLVKLQNEKDSHDIDVKELQKEREEHAADMERFSREASLHAANVEKLRREQESLRKEKESQAAEMEKLHQTEEAQHVFERDQLVKKLSASKLEISSLENELRKSKSVSGLELESLLAALEKEKGDHNAEVEEYKGKLERAESIRLTQDDTVESLNRQIGDHSNYVKKLQDQILNLKASLEAKTRQVDENDEKLVGQQHAFNQLEAQCSERVNELDNRVAVLGEREIRLKDELKEKANVAEGLQVKLAAANRVIEENKSKIGELDACLDQATNREKSTRASLLNLRSEHEGLQKELGEAKKALMHKEASSSEKLAKIQANHTREKQRNEDELKSREEKLRKEHAAQLTKLSAACDEKDAQIDKLTRHAESASRHTHNMGSRNLEIELKELKSKLLQYENNCDGLRERNKELNNANQVNEERRKKTSEVNKKLKTENAELRREKDMLESEVGKLRLSDSQKEKHANGANKKATSTTSSTHSKRAAKGNGKGNLSNNVLVHEESVVPLGWIGKAAILYSFVFTTMAVAAGIALHVDDVHYMRPT